MTNIEQAKINFLEKESILSKYATKSNEAIRIEKEDSDDIRTPYFRDIDRIIHSFSYTRYIDKTQVYSFKDNDHISKRMVHVQLVSKIARTIGRALKLNEDLIEAIALGHDIGHTPLGHAGEAMLNEIAKEELNEYFAHNIQGVRNLMIVDHQGCGQNLTIQTLDGILCHNGEILSKVYKPQRNKTIAQFWQEYDHCWHIKDYSKKIVPMTLEGCVVRISDVISYVGKDIEDAIKVGIIQESDLPDEVVRILGKDNKAMINRLIADIVIHSYDKPYLSFSNEVFHALTILFDFLSTHIHHHPTLVKENEKLTRMVKELYNAFYLDLIDDIDENHGIDLHVKKMIDSYKVAPKELIVSDYLSGMTDSYVLRMYQERFLPKQHGDMI